jgi:hypothetical protein
MPLVVSPARNSPPGISSSASSSGVHTGSGTLLALFFLCIFLPISFDVAGMKLDPLRLYMILTFFPFFIKLISSQAGTMTWTDGFMVGFNLWLFTTLVYHHGAERAPYAAVLAVEAFGGYMAGRILIRSVADYHRFIRYYLIVLVLIAPLAIYEAFTSQMVLSNIFNNFFPTVKKIEQFRYGLSRVQVAFPHPILFGLFCSLAIASIYFVYRGSLFRLIPRMAIAMIVTMTALSSAPIISMVVQIMIIIWGKVTGSRWNLLLILVLIAYVVLELFTDRGAVVIFIETFTLNPMSGWWRIHIWNFGTASVMNHPLMGIGLNDWERPEWLAPTVDNFWLLTAMRHGLPAFLFLALSIGLHISTILRLRTLGPEAQLIRKGYTITLIGLIFTLSTVFIWGSMNVMTMFFIGAGAFLYTSPPEAADALNGTPEPAQAQGRQGLPLSRFSRSAPSARTAQQRPLRAEDTRRPALPKEIRK